MAVTFALVYYCRQSLEFTLKDSTLRELRPGPLFYEGDKHSSLSKYRINYDRKKFLQHRPEHCSQQINFYLHQYQRYFPQNSCARFDAIPFTKSVKKGLEK